MAYYLPPYLGKMVEKYEKELLIAEKRVIKTEKDLEFAKEYVKLCKEKLEQAKKEQPIDEE